MFCPSCFSIPKISSQFSSPFPAKKQHEHQQTLTINKNHHPIFANMFHNHPYLSPMFFRSCTAPGRVAASLASRRPKCCSFCGRCRSRCAAATAPGCAWRRGDAAPRRRNRWRNAPELRMEVGIETGKTLGKPLETGKIYGKLWFLPWNIGFSCKETLGNWENLQETYGFYSMKYRVFL